MEDIETIWKILDEEGEVRIEGIKNGKFILAKGLRLDDELFEFVSRIREKLERISEIIEAKAREYIKRRGSKRPPMDFSYSYVRRVREALKALRRINRAEGSREVRGLLRTIVENLEGLNKVMRARYLREFLLEEERRIISQISQEVIDMIRAKLQR